MSCTAAGPGHLGQGQARAARRGQRRRRRGRRRDRARRRACRCWLSIPVTVAAGARRHPAARRRHDLAAARDDRRRPADGARRLLRPGHRDLERRGRRAGPRLQPDGRGPGRRRPRSAASWSPTSATSCGRRSPRCAPCSRTSSTGWPSRTRPALRTALDQAERLVGPGLRPARPRPGRRRRGAAGDLGGAGRWRCWTAPSAEAGCAGRDVRYDVRVAPPDLVVARRPGPAAPAGRQPARQRVPAQPRRRAVVR